MAWAPALLRFQSWMLGESQALWLLDSSFPNSLGSWWVNSYSWRKGSRGQINLGNAELNETQTAGVSIGHISVLPKNLHPCEYPLWGLSVWEFPKCIGPRKPFPQKYLAGWGPQTPFGTCYPKLSVTPDGLAAMLVRGGRISPNFVPWCGSTAQQPLSQW